MVSIHHNSYVSDKSVKYGTVLYYKDEDQALASSILQATTTGLKVKSEGIAKFNNSLLWVANMPAALTESFFITNSAEYTSILKSNSTRLVVESQSITNGIINYFTNPKSTSENIVDANLLIIDRADMEN